MLNYYEMKLADNKEEDDDEEEEDFIPVRKP
jgi:hypothetical protein